MWLKFIILTSLLTYLECTEPSSCGCSHTNRQSGASEVEGSCLKDDLECSKPSENEIKKSITSTKPRTNQMAHIPGGTYTMGTNKPIFVGDGEGPARNYSLKDFYMDIYEVSNSEFELFVKNTGYKTEVI